MNKINYIIVSICNSTGYDKPVIKTARTIEEAQAIKSSLVKSYGDLIQCVNTYDDLHISFDYGLDNDLQYNKAKVAIIKSNPKNEPRISKNDTLYYLAVIEPLKGDITIVTVSQDNKSILMVLSSLVLDGGTDYDSKDHYKPLTDTVFSSHYKHDDGVRDFVHFEIIAIEPKKVKLTRIK